MRGQARKRRARRVQAPAGRKHGSLFLRGGGVSPKTIRGRLENRVLLYATPSKAGKFRGMTEECDGTLAAGAEESAWINPLRRILAIRNRSRLSKRVQCNHRSLPAAVDRSQ